MLQVVKIWEDDRFLDEPVVENPGDLNSDDYGYYDHIYTVNQPKTREILKEFYKHIKQYSESSGVERFFAHMVLMKLFKIVMDLTLLES